MTTDTLDTPGLRYTISGTGPYAIDHEYSHEDDFVVYVLDGEGGVTPLATDEWSVAGPGPADSGNLTLTTEAASTYDGDTIEIKRSTSLEQGWEGVRAREVGMERALDRITRATQEVQRDTGVGLRILGVDSIPPVDPVDGAGFIWSDADNKLVIGPTSDEISAAQSYAEAAATAKGLSETARDKAEEWAENPEDEAVESGKYSAKHHAAKASVSAAGSASHNASASSHADAANTSLLALGEALLNVLGAFSVNEDGDLLVAYNSAVITNIEIDGSGDLLMTYEE